MAEHKQRFYTVLQSGRAVHIKNNTGVVTLTTRSEKDAKALERALITLFYTHVTMTTGNMR